VGNFSDILLRPFAWKFLKKIFRIEVQSYWIVSILRMYHRGKSLNEIYLFLRSKNLIKKDAGPGEKPLTSPANSGINNAFAGY
jgi:hypothetical protein